MRTTPCGCCAIVVSLVGLTLAIVGHILYSMRDPAGELPLWYTLQTCRRSQDMAIGPRNFDLYPLAPDGSSSECAEPYDPAASATRIMIDESDGVQKGARYYPSFLLKSESYATISFRIEDRVGNVLMPTVNLELGPEEADGYTDYPWRYTHFPPSAPPADTSPADPPPSPPPPIPPVRRMLSAARRTEAAAAAAEAAAAAAAAGLPHPLRGAFRVPSGVERPPRGSKEDTEGGESAARRTWGKEAAWEEEESEFDLDGWEIDFGDTGEEEDGGQLHAGGVHIHTSSGGEDVDRPSATVRRRRRSFGGSRFSTPTISRSTSSGSFGGGTISRPTSSTFSRSSSTTFSRSSTTIARRRTSAVDSRRRTSSGTYSATSGSYSSSAYYGGRTSTYGTARWGYATPYYYYPYYSYPLLSPYYYSPFGYYYGPWGVYYGYSYPYAYIYGPVAIRSGGVLLVVRRPNYLCTCCGGGGCDARPAESLELPADQDRYEIDEGATFVAPGGREAYPLFIVVHNATAWLDTTVETQPVIQGGVNIFLNFYTDGGGSLDIYGMGLMVFGYLLLVIGLVVVLVLACCGALCVGGGCCSGGDGGDGSGSGAQMGGAMQYQSKFT